MRQGPRIDVFDAQLDSAGAWADFESPDALDAAIAGEALPTAVLDELNPADFEVPDTAVDDATAAEIAAMEAGFDDLESMNAAAEALAYEIQINQMVHEMNADAIAAMPGGSGVTFGYDTDGDGLLEPGEYG